jgi:hypothetical protein
VAAVPSGPNLDSTPYYTIKKKLRLSVLKTAGLRVLAQYIRNSASFNFCSSGKNVLQLDDALQLLMLLGGALTYLEPKLFFLTVPIALSSFSNIHSI